MLYEVVDFITVRHMVEEAALKILSFIDIDSYPAVESVDPGSFRCQPHNALGRQFKLPVSVVRERFRHLPRHEAPAFSQRFSHDSHWRTTFSRFRIVASTLRSLHFAAASDEACCSSEAADRRLT